MNQSVNPSKHLRVAFVYDRINKFGGAERVLQALHTIWPHAPLYTAVFDSRHASWAAEFTVRPSFLQIIPLAKTHHEWFPWATPMAFESFSFDQFDVVITVTSAEAKNIITKPQTLHICYCLTPTRYLWSGVATYIEHTRVGLPAVVSTWIFRLLLGYLKRWDMYATTRPDRYIAISDHIRARISRYYKKKTLRVIYPPVRTDFFTPGVSGKNIQFPYFLTVARLVGHKRVDIIIDACTALQLHLLVIGDGVDLDRLKKRAGSTVQFVQRTTDVELRDWYRGCEAFLFAGDEDFGIAAVEAQSCGKPIIAYKTSGIAEIVQHEITGFLFEEQTVASLIEALKMFPTQWYDSSLCVTNAKRFSTDRFVREMKKTVESVYNSYREQAQQRTN